MLDPRCIYQNSFFAKCTQLACLLSFASLFDNKCRNRVDKFCIVRYDTNPRWFSRSLSNDFFGGVWTPGQALAGSRDFKSAKIPGFLKLKSRDFLGSIVTMFCYAKNRQKRKHCFLLFINPILKNPGIPRFGKIPSWKIPGLKILIPPGPESGLY